MKKIKIHGCLFFILLIQNMLVAQGGIVVNGGTLMHLNGNAKMVVEDGKFSSEGYINFQESEVIFKGSAPTDACTIYGNPFPEFYQLTIDKSQHDVKLLNHINVKYALKMAQNDLELNGNNVYLVETGKLGGEHENSRVKGAIGGFVAKTVELNQPNAENPGAMGLEITSSENLGPVTILRGHDIQSIGANESIARYFDLTPSNNQNLNATLRFNYLEAELNNVPEPELAFFRKTNGNAWEDMGVSLQNPNDNFVELSGIDHLSFWTLSNSTSALPLELLTFNAQKHDEIVLLDWQTMNEINVNYFEIQKSRDRQSFSNIGEVEAIGLFQLEQLYEYLDTEPFAGFNYYRLKIWDLDGSFEFSEIKVVNFDTQKLHFTDLYPNPVLENNCYLSIHTADEFQAKFEIYNVLGKRILLENQMLSKGENKVQFQIKEWVSGTYFVFVTIGASIWTGKLEKL